MAHSSHAACPGDGWNWPAAQRVQEEDPASAKDPARHWVHTVAPLAEEKPEGHGEHSVEPLAKEKRPAGQGTHGGTPQIEYVPARHSSRQSSISSLNQSGTRNGSPFPSTRAAPSEGNLRRAFFPRVVVP
eukprot:CAMPEP_0180188716 /NCGR_PEP_ID=MMETSP0986-20121125/44240_1 /TAXON_ID=697907 /ORGANISM="non described non described, Strain CCMP2293" /LENGTH=129 /DNA_ID=CAMNT_0022142955 /DNA_START=84 /DNA_END=473 /DNA_ORIENTATION=+